MMFQKTSFIFFLMKYFYLLMYNDFEYTVHLCNMISSLPIKLNVKSDPKDP